MKMHVIKVLGQKDLMKLDSKEFNTSITLLFIYSSTNLDAFTHYHYDPILFWKCNGLA